MREEQVSHRVMPEFRTHVSRDGWLRAEGAEECWTPAGDKLAVHFCGRLVLLLISRRRASPRGLSLHRLRRRSFVPAAGAVPVP